MVQNLVDGEQDRLRLSQRLAADGARVLERHRVPLLRHDAARLDESVAEAHVVELGGAPEQQVLHEASVPGEQNRCGRGAFEQIVDRSDAAVGVGGRAVEPEQVRGQTPVDRKARAGDRAGAERVPIGTLIRAVEP